MTTPTIHDHSQCIPGHGCGAGPSRKLRCRVLSLPLRNPCPNESLDEFGICLKHLREIAAHWTGVLEETAERFPGFRRLVAEGKAN